MKQGVHEANAGDRMLGEGTTTAAAKKAEERWGGSQARGSQGREGEGRRSQKKETHVNRRPPLLVLHVG